MTTTALPADRPSPRGREKPRTRRAPADAAREPFIGRVFATTTPNGPGVAAPQAAAYAP